MKTSFDLPEALMTELRQAAKDHGVTAKSLVEQALRDLLVRYQAEEGYRLPDASVDGDGLSPEFSAARWDEISAAAYGSRH